MDRNRCEIADSPHNRRYASFILHTAVFNTSNKTHQIKHSKTNSQFNWQLQFVPHMENCQVIFCKCATKTKIQVRMVFTTRELLNVMRSVHVVHIVFKILPSNKKQNVTANYLK